MYVGAYYINLQSGKRFQTNFYTFKTTKNATTRTAGVEMLTAGTPTTYLSEWKQAYYFSSGLWRRIHCNF